MCGGVYIPPMKSRVISQGDNIRYLLGTYGTYGGRGGVMGGGVIDVVVTHL